MSVYGRQFASVYNDWWSWRSEKLWPFLVQVAKSRTARQGRWLDLCCGSGALLKRVGETGYAAWGLDISPHQLRHARKNAPEARLIQGDVRSFSLEERFEVITCLFDSLNCLIARDDVERAFQVVASHLDDQGVFIFDINTFEGLFFNWNGTRVIRDPDRTLIVETSFDDRRAEGRCRVTGFVRIGPFFQRFEEEHVERAFDAELIEALLNKVGFAYEKLDGDTLEFPNARTCRLMYLCGKAETG